MAEVEVGNLKTTLEVDNKGFKAAFDESIKKIREMEVAQADLARKSTEQYRAITNSLSGMSSGAFVVSPKAIKSFDSLNSELKIVPKYLEIIQQQAELAGNQLESVPTKTSKGFNMLNFQMQMLARELPVLALSPQMFFLAISNNLPMLADEISNVSKKNAELAKSGESFVPTWKQIASSLLNWQTLLVVGVTLLTAYGDEIGSWVSGLFGAKKSLKELTMATEEFQSSVKSSAGEGIAEYYRLQQGWNALGDDLKAKQKFIEDNASAFKVLHEEIDTVAEAESVLRGNTEAFKTAMLERAKAAGFMAVATEKASEIAGKMLELEQTPQYNTVEVKRTDVRTGLRVGTGEYVQEYSRDYAKLNNEIKTANKELEKLVGLSTEASNKAQAGFGDFNIRVDPDIDTPTLYKLIGEQLEKMDFSQQAYSIKGVPIEFDFSEFDLSSEDLYIPLIGSLDSYNQLIQAQQKVVNAAIGEERDLAKIQLERLQIQQALAAGNYKGGLDLQNASLEELQYLWDNANDAAKRYLATLLEFDAGGAVEGIKSAGIEISGVINGFANDFASAIGSAMSGEVSEDELMATFVTPFANAAQAFGSLLIAQGVAMQALQSGNAYAMVAGGIALVALGAALSAAMSNVQNSVSSGGSVDTFTGGYNSGSSGNYDYSGTRTIDVNVTGTISGQDILLSSERARQYNRT